MRTSALITISIALCLGVALAGCGQANDRGTIGVSAESILDDPSAYYGSTVTVSGSVNRIISPTMFTIKGRESGDELLVMSIDSIAAVSGRSAAEPVGEQDIVQVTGRIRDFARDDMESEFGLDFEDREIAYESGPVIVARDAAATLSSVIVTPRPGSIVPPPGEAEYVTDVAETGADDANALVNEPAHFRELNVAEIIDENSFWAASGDDSLLVVLVPGALENMDAVDALEVGQTWEVYGILREVPSEVVLSSQWSLSADLIRKLNNDAVYLQVIYGTVER